VACCKSETGEWVCRVRGPPTGAQPRFQSWGSQFLGLGYCAEQNTDGIPSFVDCSLLRNGNHTVHQKSWGGLSKFWGSEPPQPPVIYVTRNITLIMVTCYELATADSVSDVRVRFDSRLSFMDHINDKVNKAYGILGIIKKKFYTFGH